MVRSFLLIADTLRLRHALLLAPYLSFLFCYGLCGRISFWHLHTGAEAVITRLNYPLADVMKIDGTAFEPEDPSALRQLL